jgi:hypothetical protein
MGLQGLAIVGDRLPQAVVEVPLFERRDQEVTQVVTIGEGKRPLSRVVPHFHLEECGVLTDQDHHAIQAYRFGTLECPPGEKLIALLRHVLIGTVCGDMRIRFDSQILAKLLVNGSNLLLRCDNRILTEKPCRILDASARGLGHADGDQHHSDGQ